MKKEIINNVGDEEENTNIVLLLVNIKEIKKLFNSVEI